MAGSSGAYGLLLRARGSVSWQKTFRATPVVVVGKDVVGMDVLFERVAGLDVGKGSVTVCVRAPGGPGRRRRGETRLQDDDPLAGGDAGLAAVRGCDDRGDGV